MPIKETVSEVATAAGSHKLDFDADKLIGSEAKESKSETAKSENTEPVDPDKLIEPSKPAELDKTETCPSEIEPISTHEERLNETPRETNSNGYWEGERGESKFVLTNETLKEDLARHRIDGIEYKDAKPDFSPITDTTVQIEGFSDKRYGGKSDVTVMGNFDKADTKCSEQWNQAMRDGKSNWTPSDVAKWRSEHEYSWHECNDMKTMQLVPSSIHQACRHLGGVGEYKMLNNTNGGFDD